MATLPVKKRKPLLFKRTVGPAAKTPVLSVDADADLPSSAQPTPTTAAGDGDAAGIDLFRRANTFFPRAVEEQRKLAEKQRKLSAEKAPPPDRTPDRTPEPSPERDASSSASSSAKRRKLSPEARGNGADASPPSPSRRTRRDPPASPPGAGKGKGTAQPHAVNAQIVFSDTAAAAPAHPTTETDTADDSVVVLDDDAVEAAIAKIKAEVAAYSKPATAAKTAATAETATADPPAKETDDDGGNDSDGSSAEFQEYIQRAQARDAANKAAQAVREAMVATASQSPSQTTPGWSPAETPVPSASAGDQIYRIFITARFAEPVPPLIATVRMDQKFQFVQSAFLKHARQKGVTLSEDDADRVVLTWKGRKVYQWTTGQSLDVHPDHRGKFVDNGLSEGYGSSGFKGGGLHVEVWTKELYDAYWQDEEVQRRRRLGEADAIDLDDSGSEHGGAAAPPDAAPAASQPQQRIRLVLTSRDYEKLNMTAYADTKVAMLVAAFREQRKIPPEQSIAIHWDGERLDEDETVAGAEMEDMDSVEVFVR